MPAGSYDLSMDQGENFYLHLEYLDTENTVAGANPVDVRSYDLTKLQIRRAPSAKAILLSVGLTGCTSGGPTGEYVLGSSFEGLGGTGYILLGKDEEGTGSLTGGIYIFVSGDTTKYIPAGRHFYEVELSKSGDINKLVRGRMDVMAEIVQQ